MGNQVLTSEYAFLAIVIRRMVEDKRRLKGGGLRVVIGDRYGAISTPLYPLQSSHNLGKNPFLVPGSPLTCVDGLPNHCQLRTSTGPSGVWR